MTDEELKQFLETNKSEIQSAVREKMIAGLLASHRWEISEQIGKAVNEFIAAEIVPDVRKFLQDEKGPILEAAMQSARQIGDMISKQLVTKAAENIKTSYRFGGLMEGLFK